MHAGLQFTWKNTSGRIQVEFLTPAQPIEGVWVNRENINILLQLGTSRLPWADHEARSPHDLLTLRSYMVAVNNYGKYVPEMRKLRHLMDKLLKAGTKWDWYKPCQN